jgi:hypothetical protein
VGNIPCGECVSVQDHCFMKFRRSHWLTDLSYIPRAPHIATKNLSLHCEPFDFADSTVLWREKAIRQAANQSGHNVVVAGPSMPARSTTDAAPELVVLPYFNFTAPHAKMHPRYGEDCTHFCSSPFMYYPIWRSLRFALDRQFM